MGIQSLRNAAGCMPDIDFCAVQGGLLGMVPFDPMGQISDKNRQSEVRNGRCASAPGLGWLQVSEPLRQTPACLISLQSACLPDLPVTHPELAEVQHESCRHSPAGQKMCPSTCLAIMHGAELLHPECAWLHVQPVAVTCASGAARHACLCGPLQPRSVWLQLA